MKAYCSDYISPEEIERLRRQADEEARAWHDLLIVILLAVVASVLLFASV